MSKTAIGGLLTAVVLLPLAIPIFFMGGTATQGVLPDVVPEQYVEVVTRAGSICPTVPPEIIAAQVTQESGWDTSAESPAGAQGISQFMPETWAESGMDGDGDGIADVWNPVDSIWSQGNYMCRLAGMVDTALSQGSILGDPLDLTLASYNAGFGNVKKHGGIPLFKETENYVRIIRGNAANAAVGGPGGSPSGPVDDGAIMPTLSADGTFLRSPKGVKSGLLPDSVLCGGKSFQLRCEAANGFENLNQAYKQRFGTEMKLVGGYRSYSAQVAIKAQKGHYAATPGKSNHGWGMAVDIHANTHGGTGSTKHNWLRENAPKYGWQWPSWARTSKPGPYEPWHWEYVGPPK